MLEILFQDSVCCVVNKPAMYVVHKTRGAGQSPIILQTLRDQLGTFVYPVHRLDRSTSGCLAFAFTTEGAAQMQKSLQAESAVKKYTALCFGHTPLEAIYDRELFNENRVKQKAITIVKTIKHFEKYSLVELELKTGRKHQIRRHLSHEGHHIVGDVNHGKGWLNRRFREDYGFFRMFLHCHKLQFTHPVLKNEISIDCPLGDDLNVLLEKI